MVKWLVYINISWFKFLYLCSKNQSISDHGISETIVKKNMTINSEMCLHSDNISNPTTCQMPESHSSQELHSQTWEVNRSVNTSDIFAQCSSDIPIPYMILKVSGRAGPRLLAGGPVIGMSSIWSRAGGSIGGQVWCQQSEGGLGFGLRPGLRNLGLCLKCACLSWTSI